MEQIDKINMFIEGQKAKLAEAKRKLDRSVRVASEKPYAVFEVDVDHWRTPYKVYSSKSLDRALGAAAKRRINGGAERYKYILCCWDEEALLWKEYKTNGV